MSAAVYCGASACMACPRLRSETSKLAPRHLTSPRMLQMLTSKLFRMRTPKINRTRLHDPDSPGDTSGAGTLGAQFGSNLYQCMLNRRGGYGALSSPENVACPRPRCEQIRLRLRIRAPLYSACPPKADKWASKLFWQASA